ncbi:DUF4142 domain-containing protein [Rhodoblastus acidophilus]|nr:DUF4142 domain-containing protein [Rhodoblastus acidophilus]RAI22967.1 DUF4142 domain-containing protein [Rhodoblastus acidophilus]
MIASTQEVDVNKACLTPALLLLMAGAAFAQPAPAPNAPGAAPQENKGGGNAPGDAPKPASGGAPPHASHAPAAAQPDKKSDAGRRQKLSEKDRAFLRYVAKVNRDEIELCRYAADKAQAPAIKAFARLMVQDHSGVGAQLTGLVGAKHAAAHKRHKVRHAHAHAHVAHARPRPAQPAPHAPAPASSGSAQAAGVQPPAESEAAKISRLKGRSGADFDAAFMAEQVDYHSQNLGKFDDAIKSADDDRVRRLATAIQNAFKGHLDMAKAIKPAGDKP